MQEQQIQFRRQREKKKKTQATNGADDMENEETKRKKNGKQKFTRKIHFNNLSLISH